MAQNTLTCSCPPGFDPPYCATRTMTTVPVNAFCHINVCQNGGTCIHINDNTIASMKCLCLNGFAGVFCETPTFYKDISKVGNKLPNIPSICKVHNLRINTEIIPVKVTRTPFSPDGYYIIEGNLKYFYFRAY